jgi:hypothetical protein
LCTLIYDQVSTWQAQGPSPIGIAFFLSRNSNTREEGNMIAPCRPIRAMPLLLALTIVLLVACADACHCPVIPIKTQYYKDSITRVVRAVVVFKWPPFVTAQTPKIYYQIAVKQSFKGCVKPSLVKVSTASSSAECGANLEVGSEYLLFLHGSGNALMTDSCSSNALFKDVSESDRAFLKSRNVCCGNTCACADGSPPADCPSDPCSPPAPCTDGVNCIANFCGFCRAEWFDSAGLPVCYE